MELCHQPARQHGQSVGADEKRDYQQPRAVADGIHKEYEQTEEAENGGGDAEDAAGQADNEHEKPCDDGKRRKDGRKEDFQKETHINIPPVLFVSAFSIQEAALPCKDAEPQKKQGRLTSQQAAPHGINTPLFNGGKPGKDFPCIKAFHPNKREKCVKRHLNSKNIYSKISFHFLKEYNKTAKGLHLQVS